MGMIEIGFQEIWKETVKNPTKLEPLFKKMALIIDRQAMALKAMEWHIQSVDKAKSLDELLFEDIKQLKLELHENTQETKAP